MPEDPLEYVEASEIIISESDSDQERTLYVYDPRDDFLLTIPAGAKVTFGYFNPASARQEGGGRYDNFGNPGGGGQTMRTTALRIYEKAERGNQLACFMGVTGFRDVDLVKKVVKRKKVTIETNFEDDGRGNRNFRANEMTEPLELPERVDDEGIF